MDMDFFSGGTVGGTKVPKMENDGGTWGNTKNHFFHLFGGTVGGTRDMILIIPKISSDQHFSSLAKFFVFGFSFHCFYNFQQFL